MPFKFYEKTAAQSTSQIVVSSGSGTASNLLDRNPRIKWQSSGESADGATATISWVPGSSTIVSTIMLQNHNFEGFNVIYNSNTANQFTPALSTTTNANSNTMYIFASQAVTSIDINCWNTITPNQEKCCGQLIVTKAEKIELDNNPGAASYSPTVRAIGTSKEMIDGGVVNIRLDTKFAADMDLSQIPTATYDSLTAIWRENTNFIFVPFPAETFTTYWDGQAEHVVWIGDDGIEGFRSNNLQNGYRGSISLRQIPN